MIQVKPGLIRSVEFQTKKGNYTLEYRSDLRDDGLVYVLSLDGEEIYVGEELQNIDMMFTLFEYITRGLGKKHGF